ncbi:MAG: hypothetical protein IKU85_11335, partial [Bacteroidaceae bacterium]|nr:hypothetical protein [Bacteroidaceae bacterium]
MTDLLEHTECVFQNGLLTNITIEEADRHNDVQIATIHSSTPHFSWQVSSNNQNTKQKAYHIQVATSAALLEKGMPDMWDSKIVGTNKNTAIPYEG